MLLNVLILIYLQAPLQVFVHESVKGGADAQTLVGQVHGVFQRGRFLHRSVVAQARPLTR